MNASVATRKKDDLAVLVSPLRARLTRFLRHPHTLRDCSVPRARAECWRGSASASTARKPTRAHSRRRNEQLAWCASRAQQVAKS